MSLAELKAELTAGHPDTGAYNADDGIAATEINAVNRTRNKTSLTGSEVLNNVNATEWSALTDVQKQEVWDIVHLGELNPFGVEATLLIAIFGGGSVTITALAAARKEDVSRAEELSLGRVLPTNVTNARAYHG